MKKSPAYLSVLLAGLLASAGVYAQSAYPSTSTDFPPKAGEASTQTNGVPNAQTTNSPVSEAPAPAANTAPQDTRAMGAGAVTSTVAPKPGEASTYTMGKPNIDPAKPRAMSRSEVMADLMGRPAAFNALRGQMHRQGGTMVIASAMPAQ